MNSLLVLQSSSDQDTRQIARLLGQSLAPGHVLALDGELGSGKTTFVQGLAQGLGFAPEEIHSPTFALIQEHQGRVPFCHVDLYRLAGAEISGIGLEEYWQSQSWVMAIEWAERAANWLPKDCLSIALEYVGPEERKIILSGNKNWDKILRPLKKYV